MYCVSVMIEMNMTIHIYNKVKQVVAYDNLRNKIPKQINNNRACARRQSITFEHLYTAHMHISFTMFYF